MEVEIPSRKAEHWNHNLQRKPQYPVQIYKNEKTDCQCDHGAGHPPVKMIKYFLLFQHEKVANLGTNE